MRFIHQYWLRMAKYCLMISWIDNLYCNFLGWPLGAQRGAWAADRCPAIQQVLKAGYWNVSKNGLPLWDGFFKNLFQWENRWGNYQIYGGPWLSHFQTHLVPNSFRVTPSANGSAPRAAKICEKNLAATVEISLCLRSDLDFLRLMIPLGNFGSGNLLKGDPPWITAFLSLMPFLTSHAFHWGAKIYTTLYVWARASNLLEPFAHRSVSCRVYRQQYNRLTHRQLHTQYGTY